MITENTVVAMHYVLKDTEGNLLDSSDTEQAFEYLQGHGNIIVGLEKALVGLATGDKKVVESPPEEGYGHYNPDLRFNVAKEQFGDMTPELGMMIQLSTNQGQPFLARVVAVETEQVVKEANNPLAGKALVFDVEIAGVRPATAEEIQHGHPHGPGGHHH